MCVIQGSTKVFWRPTGINAGDATDLLFSPPLTTGPQRTEKIDGNALKAEMHRLSNLSHMTDRDKRWLDWLNEPCRWSGVGGLAPDANGIRLLTVVYGKTLAVVGAMSL